MHSPTPATHERPRAPAAPDARRLGRRADARQGDDARGRVRPRSGRIRRCARSSSSCSTCSPTASTTVHDALATHPDVPLQVHARYTRIEILAAFGVGAAAKVAAVADRRLLGERSRAPICSPSRSTRRRGQFSPTTRYRDYAISRDLIHWESQSVTRADSETGRRYQTHRDRGTSIMLFARLRDGRSRVLVPGARPATCSHESSCRWRSPGGSTTRCPAICSRRSPRRSPDRRVGGYRPRPRPSITPTT